MDDLAQDFSVTRSMLPQFDILLQTFLRMDDDDEYDNFYGAITQHMPLQGHLHKKLVACQRYDFSK